MKLYVGNLSYDVTDDELREAFGAHGQVTSADVVKDRQSGQSKGFGFVEMPSKDEATAAMEALNGTDLRGRTINVNEARPRTDGGGGGGRRGGGGGGFGGRGGGGGGGGGGGFGGRGGGGGGGRGGRW
jgi:RNA recognition motif-containing protein